jgi:8-oxo-dGTP pyrophosphatase MutT (NUDIX family)
MPEIVSNVIQLHPVRVAAGEVEHLLLLRSDRVAYARGIWQVITGRIEPGETTMEAARRELLEETGLAGEGWAVLPQVATFYFEPTDQVILSPIILCELPPAADPVLSHEHVEFAWLRLDRAQERIPYPSQREGMLLVEQHIRRRYDRQL